MGLTSLLLPSIISLDKQTAEQLLFKMRGFLILLSVLLVLEGNEAYEQLNPRERGIVDEAIEKANKEFGKQQHLDYSSVLQANDGKGMLHVLLKPTSCEKITPAVHQAYCEIQEKAKPQVSCVACHEDMRCFLLRDHVKTTKAKNDCLGMNQGMEKILF